MNKTFVQQFWRPSDCTGFIGKPLLGTVAMCKKILRSPPRGLYEHDEWYQHITPTRDQGALDQCLGKALAEQATALYRKHHGKGVFPARHRISGYRIWAHARGMFYGGDLNGGLTMDEGIAAVKDLRLYPDGTMFERPQPTPWELLKALAYTPVVQGTWTWPGWGRPHPQSGYVGRMTGFGGGHATLVMAMDRNGDYWTPVFLNSWGVTWGRHGFGTLTSTQYETVQLALPVAVRVPKHFEDYQPPADLVDAA